MVPFLELSSMAGVAFGLVESFDFAVALAKGLGAGLVVESEVAATADLAGGTSTAMALEVEINPAAIPAKAI